MANEITLLGQLRLANPAAGVNTNDSFAPGQVTADQAGTQYVKGTMTVTNSATQIPIGSIGTMGYAMFENLGTTNDILLRLGAGGTDTLRIKPGKTSGPMLIASGTWYASTPASTSLLNYFMCEA